MIKKFFIILFITIIIFCNINCSYATYYDDLNNYKTDPIQYLKFWQDNLQSSLFNIVINQIGNKTVDELEGDFQKFVNTIINDTRYIYVVYQNNNYYVFVYNSGTKFNAGYEGSIDISLNQSSIATVPTILHKQSGLAIFNCYTINPSPSNFSCTYEMISGSSSPSIPDSLIFYNSQSLLSFREFMEGNDISKIATAIEENTQIQQETNQKLQEQNDFLKEDIKEEEIDSTLPSIDSSSDITSSGVDSIFTAITNGINNNNPIKFTILDNEVTISKDMLSDNLPSSITSILGLFWWFFISYRIFKDIINLFEKVTTGEIDKVDTTNVKADLF